MNKLMFAGLVSSLALLGGCSSNPMDDNHVGIIERPEDIIVPDKPPEPEVVQEIPDGIPDWYINLPKDSEEKIYGSGAGLSSDLQFSIDKAMHQAKIVLGDKISTNVSAEIKTYMADNSSIGGGMTVEETQRVSKSGFKNIDVSAYEILNKSVYRERNKFRSFILLSLDITDKEERIQSDHVITPVDIESVKRAQEEARKSMNEL
jgi:hypothetical protein